MAHYGLVVRENADRASATAATQQEAERIAKVLAENNVGSEFIDRMRSNSR